MKWKASDWAAYVGVALLCLVHPGAANPDAKRLYDDLLSTYNRLIRPVSNNNDTVLVKLGLRLSQLIELVSRSNLYTCTSFLPAMPQRVGVVEVPKAAVCLFNVLTPHLLSKKPGPGRVGCWCIGC